MIAPTTGVRWRGPSGRDPSVAVPSAVSEYRLANTPVTIARLTVEASLLTVAAVPNATASPDFTDDTIAVLIDGSLELPANDSTAIATKAAQSSDSIIVAIAIYAAQAMPYPTAIV